MPEQSKAWTRCCRLRLLGRWQLVADGEDIELGHREERLVALLGLTGRSSRLHVAGILWPESTDAQALASLRRAVLQTRRRCPGLLQADRLNIELDPDVAVDVAEVRRTAAATEDTIAEDGAALLGQVVGEELLPGWYDDWVLPEREDLGQLRVKAFDRIARHALEADDLALVVAAARAASDVDPLLESAAELVIRAHLARGDVGSALLEFGRYRDALREELGVTPSRTLQELIDPAVAESRVVVEREVEAPPEVAVVPPPVVPPLAAATPAVRPTVTISPPPLPAPRESVESSGGRRVVVRLAGLAASVLVAALVVAAVGHQGGGGEAGAPGVTVSSPGVTVDSPGVTVSSPGVTLRAPMRVVPADRVIRANQLVVRVLDAGAGRAAFLVRTTSRPALVRLELRGDAGRKVVRSALVRGPEGRRLEVSGLAPGPYRWLATSSVTPAVSGMLRMPDPVVNVAFTLEAAGPRTTGASTDDASQSTGNPHHSTGRSHPTGQPRDPGAVPAGPVG